MKTFSHTYIHLLHIEPYYSDIIAGKSSWHHLKSVSISFVYTKWLAVCTYLHRVSNGVLLEVHVLCYDKLNDGKDTGQKTNTIELHTHMLDFRFFTTYIIIHTHTQLRSKACKMDHSKLSVVERT